MTTQTRTSSAARAASAALGAALALSLCACGSAAAPGQDPGVITVNATASVEVVPDVATFTTTITTEGESASAAQKAHAKPVNKVLARLKELGISDKDIQTTYTDVSPLWDENGETDTYEARTTLQVDNVAIDDLGTVMQACTDAGATEVSGVQYHSGSYEESYQEALSQAIANSRPKAEAIAAASRVSLGKVTSVTEGWQDMTYATQASNDVAMGTLEKGMEIAPGQVAIEANVTVSYAIE